MQDRFINICPSLLFTPQLFIRRKCLSILVWKSGSIMYLIMIHTFHTEPRSELAGLPPRRAIQEGLYRRVYDTDKNIATCQHVGKARTKAHCLVTSLKVRKLPSGQVSPRALLVERFSQVVAVVQCGFEQILFC